MEDYISLVGFWPWKMGCQYVLGQCADGYSTKLGHDVLFLGTAKELYIRLRLCSTITLCIEMLNAPERICSLEQGLRAGKHGGGKPVRG